MQRLPPRTVQGMIVRRSCMGKALSFADIRCTEESEHNARDDVVRVTFQRGGLDWNDAASPTRFPIKTTHLPYGALAFLELTPQANSDGVYGVVTWKLLEDPKRTAEARATVGEDKEALGGISYSAYLRERGTRFIEHTIKGQKIHQQQQSGSATPTLKRPRTEPSSATRTTPSSILSPTRNMNDDLDRDGGHGDKMARAMRARVFAQWLLETFGSTLLSGGGVLDVAGGKGHLAVELASTGRIPCVVIDPLIRKKHCQNGTNTFPVKRDAKKIRKAQGPLPRHLPTCFNQTTFLERHGKRRSNADDPSIDRDDDDSYLIQNCSTMVGLHPDETTQDILEIALSYHKSVAVVPCCVFPSFFPIRRLQDGTMVNTHSQFCQYLCEKDPSLRQAMLPFSGRNVVVYRKLEPIREDSGAVHKS